MSSGTVDVLSAINAIPDRKVPGAVVGAGIGAMVLGLAGFGYGLATAPEWAWSAALVGILYTLSLAQGGVIFSVIATVTWARWSRPLKRVAEAFGFFVPVAWLALIAFLLFGTGLYPWNPDTFVEGGPVSLEPHYSATLFAAKPVWLSKGFFITRQIVGVGLLLALNVVYLRASLRPDLIQAKAVLGAKAPAWWDRIIGTPSASLEKAVEEGQATQTKIAPVIGVVYALVFSMLAFDLIMSLSPLWYSNMFGGWYFTNSFWLAAQGIGVFTLFARDWLGLGDAVKSKTMHDLGKLILGFTMAWAYMLFAQILPIWYTNMPEETDYLMVRMILPQWSWLAKTVAILCFVMPFTVLVSRGIKKLRWPFAAMLAVMMFGVFLERTLLVVPSVYKGDEFPIATFLIVSVGVWIGFLGAFFTVVTQVIAKLPALPISDPKLEDHPWDLHAHSLDHHDGHGAHHGA